MASLRKQIAATLYALGDAVGGLDSRAERETKKQALDLLSRISSNAQEGVEEADEEAQRREQEGLLNPSIPEQWHSHYYMRQGYRVSATDDESQGHWRGGEPQHDGAECPICKKPFLLFWDINCRDPRFQLESATLFGELDRLPLYYCCRRPEPTVYQVLPDRRVRTFTPEMRSWEESPFSEFPATFARRPLKLESIPRDIENLRLISNVVGDHWLNEAEQAKLAQYLGPDSFSGDALSQFGGIPNLDQGHQRFKCPNPDCLTHRMGHPILQNKPQYEMKELAVIGDDAGFEMETNAAQIAFHICWQCHTVQADYRCT
jgi:hypothetical protein